jgi:serine/threonine-protein kinase
VGFEPGFSEAASGIIGRFRLVERIGVGGFGSVFKALDPETGRFVAVKTCDLGEDAHARFFREARLAAGLRHPGITAVYESGMAGDRPFMVQELLSGRDLSVMIAEREPYALDARRRILARVADALAYAHGEKVIHRDIKPSNVRVLEDGAVKIMDFGIAKTIGSTTGMTRGGMSVGTYGYISPEQISGEAIGPHTDIFLLGLVGYELLAFRPAFRHANLFRLMDLIFTQEPDPLIDVAPTVPPQLSAVVERALRKRPEDRFESAAAMRDALERVALP